MLLSIKQTITPNKKEKLILDALSYSASKLWNIANYEKRNYKDLGLASFPDWYDQKKRLKNEFWYKNLPSQTAQEVLNTLHQSWKSFFTLNKTKGIKNPNPPKFKHKNITFKYLNNGFLKMEDGSIRLSLPKQLKTYLKSEHNIDDNFLFLKTKRFLDINAIKQIQLTPLNDNKYEVILIYEVEDTKKLVDNGNYLSIDLGIKNLLTCYDNKGHSFIISGNRYLNTNYYYHKKIAYYQAISDKQQNAKGVEYPKKSKRVLALYKKKNDIINDIVHKATRYVADYCKDNHINTVVIGDITNIRDNNSLGKKTNQAFHSLPFDKIFNKLKYKLDRYGISLIKQKESYSSQCSPDSLNVSKDHAKKSNRKHRGLYVNGSTIYNADAVGAYNILRLYKQESKNEIKHLLKGLSNPLKVAV